MHRRRSSVKRHQILAVGSHLLVQLKCLFRNVSIDLFRTGDRRRKERQSFPAIIAHGNAGRGHDGHERVQDRVGETPGHVFPRGVALEGGDGITCVIRQAVEKTGCHNETGQQTEGFVAKHPQSLLFFGGLLGIEDGADATDHGESGHPVEGTGNAGVVKRRAE